jgi:flagellar biogenesis protein FliO
MLQWASRTKERKMQINYPNDNKFSNFFKKINRKWLYIAAFFLIALIGFVYFYYNSGPAAASADQGKNSLGAAKTADSGASSDLAASNSQLLSEINSELTQTGQSGSPAASQPQTSSGSGIYSFLKVILGLAVVIILIYLTVFILRFINKNRVNSSVRLKAGKNLIKVLDSANISANKSIQLVSVAGKMIIIGVTDSTISFLSEVAPGKTKDVDEFLQDTQGEEPIKTNFKK